MSSRLKEAAMAFREVLERPSAGPDQFVHNKPPFIGYLLADLESIGPTHKQNILSEVVSRSHQYDIPYLKTIMMRKEGDPTGLMGLIIGKSQSPEQTVEILTAVGKKTLEYLKQGYGAEQEALFTMFSGGRADWKNVPIANDLLLFALCQLKKDGITQSAENFLRSNEYALKDLFRDENRKSQLKARHKDMDPKLWEARIPTIIYAEKAPGVIKQQYMLPAMPEENVRMLQAILPEETEISALMRDINMGGHPLVRAGKEVIEELLKPKKKPIAEMNSQQIQFEVLRELQARRYQRRRY
jgi:hypothetical protein